MMVEDTKRRLSDWFRQWQEPLRQFLKGKARVRSADVDDVAQEVFLRLMRYEKGELVEHPKAYLYKVAVHVAAEWSIRASSRLQHDEKWLASLTGGEEPDGVLQRAQSLAEIKRALAALPPEQSEVLRLRFIEELGHDAIAERIGEPLHRVRRHVARGYEALRLKLDPGALRMGESAGLQNGGGSHGRE